MQSLHIDPTEYSPKIDFDAKQGVLDFSGDSYHNRTMEIFKPVVSWLDDFLKTTELDEIIVNFRMRYYNTVTSRRFLDILDMLEYFEVQKKRRVTVNWYYHQTDIDMFENGQDFSNDTRLVFNFKEIAS